MFAKKKRTKTTLRPCQVMKYMFAVVYCQCGTVNFFKSSDDSVLNRSLLFKYWFANWKPAQRAYTGNDLQENLPDCSLQLSERHDQKSVQNMYKSHITCLDKSYSMIRCRLVQLIIIFLIQGYRQQGFPVLSPSCFGAMSWSWALLEKMTCMYNSHAYLTLSQYIYFNTNYSPRFVFISGLHLY